MRLFGGPHWVLSLGLAATALTSGWSASVDVSSFELYSRGKLDSDTINLETEGEIDIAFRGGVKFGGEIALGLLSHSLEQEIAERLYLARLDLADSTGMGLAFRSASIIIRELFSLPLSLTYFVGESDDLGSGAAFSDVFGSPSIASEYAGFLYFPDSVRYQGIHTVWGTGIRLALRPLADRYYAALYAYQDGNFYDEVTPGVVEFDPGRYSFDLHGAADLGRLRLEAFVGATVPVSSYGYYRGGFLFHASDAAGEFLAEIGVPQWDPADSSEGLDLFFTLFEARIHLGALTLVPTVFLHPGTYLQCPTGEAGLVDFNVSLRLGDRSGSLASGGLESNIAFKEENLQELEATVSPFVRFATAGALWQIKANVRVFPSMRFEAFVGVKAEF